MERAEFRIHGMDCAEEVSLLRRALSRHRGIFDLTFDVVQARMTVEFDPHRTDPGAIVRDVSATGLRAEPWQDSGGAIPSWWERRGRELLALLSGAALFTGMAVRAFHTGDLVGAFLSHDQHGHPLPWHVIALFIAATAAGLYFSIPKAIGALRQWRPDMNALVAISALGAMWLGEWSEGATVAFLFALANLLESWSIDKARNAVGALIGVTPREALVVHGDHHHTMPVDRVPVNAVVRVRPGERLPFDGVVVEGTSAIDQALITGESVPILKRPGDSVYAGTINGDGGLDIRTTRPASDTTLARIVRMVSDSDHRRAASEQWVERFARVYTPVMILLAGAVITIPPLVTGGTLSYWFYQGMVILLISCPCALVISTPVTIVAALTSAARQGVLVKGGAYLERAARLRAMAFDKTGVLTKGDPVVSIVEPFDNVPPREFLARIAGLEMRSEHPLARAIVRYAAEQGVAPTEVANFQALQGRGAEAEEDGEKFWVGSNRILLEKRLADAATVEERMMRFENADHSVVVCGRGDKVWGVIGLNDRVRPEAAESIADLKRLGIERVVMVTGDNKGTARAVAQALALDEVKAEMLPDDKVAEVNRLMSRYGSVGMVGDGVNDAQALAAATLGIAVGGRGSDVALETADVILINDDLRRIPFLLRHSRRTLAIVKQNVAFALATKAAFLVTAAFGVATLWMAIAADMGATLLVTLNGLRLLRVAHAEVRAARASRQE